MVEAGHNMAEEKEFDLKADPFQTGFEVKEDITTDDVVKWIEARDSFRPKDKGWNDPLWWKANAKSAIQGGWFTVPTTWTVESVGTWPLAQTRWLSDWVIAKYQELATVPFGN